MDGIEAITRGWWRPSPGSVYPLLERMEAEGTVRKRSDGRYELTPKANAELEVSFGIVERNPRTAEDAVAEMQGLVSFIEDLSRTRPEETKSQKAKLNELAKRLSDLPT